jgi:hypothetical protein
MKQLSPQKRKLVSFLCKRRGAVPVKEITEECRLSQQATAAQLHSLREKAFARTEALVRESWYELCDPLMRLVFEIKESRERPIRLIVDFLPPQQDAEPVILRLCVNFLLSDTVSAMHPMLYWYSGSCVSSCICPTSWNGTV